MLAKRLACWIVGQCVVMMLPVAARANEQTGTGSMSRPQANLVTKAAMGLHIHRHKANPPWKQISFGSWRLWDAYVTWKDLEPSQGLWRFEALDAMVEEGRKNNVELLLPLGVPAQWAASQPNNIGAYGPGSASKPKTLDLWIQYVEKLATRYRGRIKHYEIWNEPSDKKYFQGSIDDLVELTCAAHRAIKAIDPEALIVSPASAGTGGHIDYLHNWLKRGGKRCIDVVAHHFYVPRHLPEQMLTLIDRVRQIMAEEGVGHLPLWNTETGWWIQNTDGSFDRTSMNESGWKPIALEDSGDLVERAVLLSLWAGVQRFYWYSWDHRAMGLFDERRQVAKPAVASWNKLSQQLDGATRPVCEPLPAGRWQCSFVDRHGKTQTRLW
jgi:Glycosyl hydrolases family 39